MFPYTVKYTDSESDIQDKDLLYKIHNNSKSFPFFCKKMKNKNEQKTIPFYFVIGINSIIRFCNVCEFFNFGILGLSYLYIYYTCRSLTCVGLLHIVWGHTLGSFIYRLCVRTEEHAPFVPARSLQRAFFGWSYYHEPASAALEHRLGGRRLVACSLVRTPGSDPNQCPSSINV